MTNRLVKIPITKVSYEDLTCSVTRSDMRSNN